MPTQRKIHALARDVVDRADRRVQLVDIQNLAGGADVGIDEFRRVWHAYRHHAVSARPGDLILVASSRFGGAQAALALFGEPVQWRWRDGAGGAGSAFSEYLDLPHLARRFRTLIVASGDGALTDVVEEARAAGMASHQVLGRGASSPALWDACQTHGRIRLGAVHGESDTGRPIRSSAA